MLIIGIGVTEVLLSTLVFTCETCGNHAAHQLTKQNRKFSLFFIPPFSVGNETSSDSRYRLGADHRGRARSRQRQRPGTSAPTCGDLAKAFIKRQGRLTNGPGASPALYRGPHRLSQFRSLPRS